MEYYKGHKVRDLSEMFIKEKDFHKYSLEQFKEWLRKAAPEDDWSEIKVWGMLYRFDSIALDNKEILEYLFQLGLNPKFIYSKNIDTIRSIEQGYRDPQYIEYEDEIIKDAKELVSICEKYMTDNDRELALYFYEESKYV